MKPAPVRPAPVRPAPVRRASVRPASVRPAPVTRSIVAATCLLAGLAGCTSTTSEPEAVPAPEAIAVAPTPETAPAPVSGTRKRAALIKAAEAYTNAYFAGDAVGTTAYLHPTLCDAADRAAMALEAPEMKSTARGATVKITSVYVKGNRGGVDTQRLSAGAPDALRRVVKQWDDGKRHYAWRWTDREWYLAGPCVPAEEYAVGGPVAV